jgi:tRNA dimethylallyltransferase
MAAPGLIIAGPTASGKSALAVAVAETFRGTVINADSMQLYRDLRILSGRPDAATMERVPHRLYGVLRADETSSAGRWRRLALGAIAEANEDRRVPIVVGGTGLYLEALLAGLHAVPHVPEEVRAALRKRLTREGSAALHAELALGDAATAARLNPADSQRVLRALEVMQSTGRPLSEWQHDRRAEPASSDAFRTLLLLPPRETINAACDARFDDMLAAGAVAEARHMASLGLDPALPAMKAVGLPPLLRHLRGEIALAEAVRLAKRDTRRYAKRQMTWFRNRTIAARTWTAQFSESLKPEIFSFVSSFLLTPAV